MLIEHYNKLKSLTRAGYFICEKYDGHPFWWATMNAVPGIDYRGAGDGVALSFMPFDKLDNGKFEVSKKITFNDWLNAEIKGEDV